MRKKFKQSENLVTDYSIKTEIDFNKFVYDHVSKLDVRAYDFFYLFYYLTDASWRNFSSYYLFLSKFDICGVLPASLNYLTASLLLF